MSANKKVGGGFNPVEPTMSSSQFQSQQEFFFAQVERFKKLFEDSTLAKYIIMAGVSGVVLAGIEIVRVVMDLVRFIRTF